MFYSLPYWQLGFRDDEWESMTPSEKSLIKDWTLNGRDETRTILYREFIDDTRLRKLIHKFDLYSRPRVQVTLQELHIY